MAFTLGNFDKLSQNGLTQIVTLWGYSTALDALAAVSASAYFNDVADRLKIGDVIFVKASDGNATYRVTAVSPNVTVA